MQVQVLIKPNGSILAEFDNLESARQHRLTQVRHLRATPQERRKLIDDVENVFPITSDNSLTWIALFQLIAGRSCCFCGFTWKGRGDMYRRDAVRANMSDNYAIACNVCWNVGRRL